ncbi:MAG TPA: lysophospholipid acyltransferase family protein [Candidatus Sulfotelmatobacter sp.]|nr:lysophospholipid acyltransferase family protein [Candidatus Sulfotelmatobacter sp.]
MTRWYQHGYHTPLWHRVVFATIPHVPKILQPPIGVVTALIFFFLLGKERRALVSNLSRICPGGTLALRWKAYRVFYSFCDFMVSYCYVPQATHDELLRMLAAPYKGREIIDGCLREGNGVIVWTAHLGNWEFASRLLELHGRTVNVARVVEQGNPAEDMLRDLMTNDLLKVVQLNEDATAPLRLIYALRANEIVAIQGDRVYQPFQAQVPFFGAQAQFPLGPFLLSYVSGAPIVPGFVLREGWLRYRGVVGKPISLSHTKNQDEDLRAGIEQATRFLEETVRLYPDQWLNFFEFWKEGSSPAVSAVQQNDMVAHS